MTLILARNLAENVRLAAFLLDVDGKLVFFNEAASVLARRANHRRHRPAHHIASRLKAQAVALNSRRQDARFDPTV